MVVVDRLSARKVAKRLSVPKTTMENWVLAFRLGKLADIGKGVIPRALWRIIVVLKLAHTVQDAVVVLVVLLIT